MGRLAFDIPTYSALIAAIAYTALFLRLRWRRNGPSGDVSRAFDAALLSSALWAWLATVEPNLSAVPRSAVLLLDVARFGCWFGFLLLLLKPVLANRGRAGLPPFTLIAALLVAFGVATAVLGSPSDRGGLHWSRAALFESLALPVFGLILVEQLLHSVADDSRWNAKPLGLGLLVIFVFDIYLYSRAALFGRPDDEALGMRAAIHALATPLLFVAFRRRRNWALKLEVSRTAVFRSAALILAGTYLLLVAAIGYYIRYFGGEWGAALQLVSLCAALIGLATLAVSGSVRSRLRVLMGKHLFSYRYDYREEWLRFTAMLSANESPAEMGSLVVRGLADLVESPNGALWTKDLQSAAFVQSDRWNAPHADDREPIESAFARHMLAEGSVIDLKHHRHAQGRFGDAVVPEWLAKSSGFWLVIPLIVADDLVGFVVLGPPRAPLDINWEVTDLLKTASRQAAAFLSQMRATEALLESRKFDAFNRMSAFVVHDLKNIITQLSLMMKNAKRLHDNREFQQDMLATVENSLEKMRQLMLQLREGEAPPGGQSGVDLARIAQRIGAVAADRGRRVEVDVIDAVVTRGHEERIERVLGHVVQNALDATGSNDRVWLKVRRAVGQAQVEVGDTGSGMSQDYVKTMLFKPFQSTKPAGMGIGAYESYQYVRELGGTVSVDTELDRGTVMTISLPLFDSQVASDLQPAGAQ